MIDLNSLIILKPETRHTILFGINVLENGKINLNGRLNKELVERELEIRISSDGNIIVLNPNGEIRHKFPKSGSVKNMEIVRILKKSKKEFPVHYDVEWNEEQNIWIGMTGKVGRTSPNK